VVTIDSSESQLRNEDRLRPTRLSQVYTFDTIASKNKEVTGRTRDCHAMVTDIISLGV
jgi:hypothetical protein